MKCRKPHPERDEHVAISELEAAETLAGLVRCPSIAREDFASVGPFQTTCRPFSISTTTVSPEKTCQDISVNLCSTSRQLNPTPKTGTKLTEAQHEERRMRRVLANRESARQTIIRRQAMYKDLVTKEADLSKENDNLKKARELAMKNVDSLKDRNACLKTKLAKIKKPVPGDNSKMSSSGFAPRIASCFSNDPFWPAIHPLHFPCQFPIPHEGEGGSVNQASTVVFLPITCLLPFVAPGSSVPVPVHPKNAPQCRSKHGSRGTPPEKTNGDQCNVMGEASSGMGRHDYGKEPEDISSPIEARWKRKELLRMRNRSRH